MNLPLIVKRIVYGGSSHLSAVEVSVLDAVCAQLSAEESLALDAQVREIETVKNDGGQVVTVWYRQGAQARPLTGDEFCLAKLRLEEEGRKSSATLWIHQGRLQSFEYTRRPDGRFSVLAVKIRPAKIVSTASAIDRLEHP